MTIFGMDKLQRLKLLRFRVQNHIALQVRNMIVIKRVRDLEGALPKWPTVINGFVFNTCRLLYLMTIHGGVFVYDVVLVEVPTSDVF